MALPHRCRSLCLTGPGFSVPGGVNLAEALYTHVEHASWHAALMAETSGLAPGIQTGNGQTCMRAKHGTGARLRKNRYPVQGLDLIRSHSAGHCLFRPSALARLGGEAVSAAPTRLPRHDDISILCRCVDSGHDQRHRLWSIFLQIKYARDTLKPQQAGIYRAMFPRRC